MKGRESTEPVQKRQNGRICQIPCPSPVPIAASSHNCEKQWQDAEIGTEFRQADWRASIHERRQGTWREVVKDLAVWDLLRCRKPETVVDIAFHAGAKFHGREELNGARTKRHDSDGRDRRQRPDRSAATWPRGCKD